MRRWRRWAIGLVPLLVVVAVVVVVVVRQRDRDVAQDRPGTVLLVAGYGGSTAALGTLRQRLQEAGRRVEIVPPVGDNTGDLAAQAEQLREVAERAVDDGAPSVDVVGYSAGGVVARLWVAEYGGDDVARRVVTLGSPHHGTRVAALGAGLGGCPAACRALVPDSDVLRDLPETPAGPRWTSIWTADDETVVPPSSARLRGGVTIELQQVCPTARVAHGDLPRDPLATGLVLLALDGAPLTKPPTTAECGRLSS
jgi:triacylglycerol esterase/lipase EstA (alpha/beta hydrolase family)